MLLMPLRASAQPPVTPEPSPPPKPAVSVSFERQTIRENDAVEVHVLFANEWNQDLSSVVLYVNAPASLTWNALSCKEWSKKSYQGGLANPTLDLGAVGAHQLRVTALCVKSQPDLMVGDFNILFTFDYAWLQNNIAQHSFVTSEKTLKANLFGSDTVAGVPLALAGFIVPGLFFWLVVSWFNLPWGVKDLALGDKLLFSILVSFPIIYLVNGLRFPNVSTGISLIKLLLYASVGAAAGLLLGGSDKLRRRLNLKEVERQKKVAEEEVRLAKERQVKFGDDAQVLLGKLLNQYPDYQKPRAVIVLDNGTEYSGSLAAKADEATALIGWFQIERDKIKGDNRQEIIQKLEQAQRPLDLFNIARQYNLQISLSDPIFKEEDGISQQQEDDSIILPSEQAEVKALSQNESPAEPLILV
jgi:hypothetical protein